MNYGQWIEAWTIMMKYAEPSPGQPEITDPPEIYAQTAADHDIFYFPATAEDLPEDSEDGKRLIEIGLHIDSDTTIWAAFT